MRNDYDRFHADIIFSPETSPTNFSPLILKKPLKGFCDVVLVPDEPGLPPRLFSLPPITTWPIGKKRASRSQMVLLFHPVFL